MIHSPKNITGRRFQFSSESFRPRLGSLFGSYRQKSKFLFVSLFRCMIWNICKNLGEFKTRICKGFKTQN